MKHSGPSEMKKHHLFFIKPYWRQQQTQWLLFCTKLHTRTRKFALFLQNFLNCSINFILFWVLARVLHPYSSWLLLHDFMCSPWALYYITKVGHFYVWLWFNSYLFILYTFSFYALHQSTLTFLTFFPKVCDI